MFLQPLVVAAISMARLAASAVSPDSIDEATREYWCTMQTKSCPLICYQLQTDVDDSNKPQKNKCDPSTLSYECICGNGATPNATKFSQTIPYFICEEENNRCVKNCGGEHSCQSDCRENHPCGAQNPDRVTTTLEEAAPTAATTSSASDVVYTGLGGDSASSGDDSGAAARPAILIEGGQRYGLGVMVAGFLGGFALLL